MARRALNPHLDRHLSESVSNLKTSDRHLYMRAGIIRRVASVISYSWIILIIIIIIASLRAAGVILGLSPSQHTRTATPKVNWRVGCRNTSPILRRHLQVCRRRLPLSSSKQPVVRTASLFFF